MLAVGRIYEIGGRPAKSKFQREKDDANENNLDSQIIPDRNGRSHRRRLRGKRAR
jgi:hypothetical protein